MTAPDPIAIARVWLEAGVLTALPPVVLVPGETVIDAQHFTRVNLALAAVDDYRGALARRRLARFVDGARHVAALP